MAHSGGIVGMDALASRNVSSAVFSGARRYHSGGLAGDEVPAILQRGEGVFTRGQMRAIAAGGGTSITVIDQRTTAGAQPVQVSESRGGDGRRQISILVRDEVRRAMGSGDLDSAMRSNFGATRPTVTR